MVLEEQMHLLQEPDKNRANISLFISLIYNYLYIYTRLEQYLNIIRHLTFTWFLSIFEFR